MFRFYSIVLLTGLMLQVTVCGAIPADFEPYQAIIDREIFGKRVVPSVASPLAAEAIDQKLAEKLAKRLTMCAVNRTPSGNTAVGFIDNEVKPPRNIYLNVGESTDGYHILAADYDAETATIEKDGVTVTLQLGKGLVVAAAGGAVSATGRPIQIAPSSLRRPTPVSRRDPGIKRPVPPGVVSGTVDAPSPADTTASYRAGLQERKTQEQARVEQERKAEDQAAKEKFVALAREIAAAEVRKQVLAEHGLEEADLPLDDENEGDTVEIGEL